MTMTYDTNIQSDFECNECAHNERTIKKLESQVKELREAGNALIEAMNQYSFFADGFTKGSASLAEYRKASEDQHAAYSKMFDVLKSLNKQP